MNITEHIISSIAPHTCAGCGQEGHLLCPTCAQNVPVIPKRCYACHKPQADWRPCRACSPALDEMRVCTSYDGLAKQVIMSLKFGRAQAAATDIATQMVRMHADMTPTVITHLPTASSRIRVRGYDQSARIAQALAKQLRRPYVPLLIRMSQHRQVGGSRAARQAAASTLFRARNMPLVQQAHILIVDDVITTGASVEAAAYVLRSIGALHVAAIAFAAA